jgi:hypothetical protein
VKLREALQDDAAAAISRQNLAFVLAPVSDIAYARSTAPRDDLGDVDSFALRGRVQPVSRVKTTSVLTLSLTGLLSAVAGWFGYMALSAGVSVPLQQTAPRGGGAHVATTPASARTPPGGTGDPTASAAPLSVAATEPPGPDRANILIFTARPGSIASAGPTELCYAVSDAFQARIEPGVGDVTPASALTCRRVAPVRTTTYQLTAYGRDGVRVTQQVVIVVR